MDLISIIVPVYNVEKYLEQCIDSLVNQTYKNIEIIIVNDGSTDSSGELCDKLAKRDSRINVVHKKNAGLGFARNTGLEFVKGKYVTFIDSDDFADVDLIENLYNEIILNNADTCIGGFKRVNDDGKVLYKEKYKSVTYSGNEVVQELLLRILGSSPEKSDAIRMSVWNVLFSVEIIKNNNLKFCSERKYISEDLIFDIDYYQHSKKTSIINSCAYNYRVNNNSLTMKYRDDKFVKCRFLYNEVCNKIKESSLSSDAILRLQRQYFVNIRTCISQENIKVSRLNYNSAIKNIDLICNDKQLQTIIKEYPKNKIGIKQCVFLGLIQLKMSKILYLSSVIGIL